MLGIIEHGGEVATRVIPSSKAKHVMPAILQWVRPGSRIATDEAMAFGELFANGCLHGTVNHSEKEYVSGSVHTNSIEAFWSHVKRSISGTYVNVSKKWLQTYLWELKFRQNLRKHPHPMLDLLLQAFPRPAKAGE